MMIDTAPTKSAALPKVSVFFISLSVPDFVLGFLWIAERSNSPEKTSAPSFVGARDLADRVPSTLSYVVRHHHEMHENKFNHENSAACGGIPSAFILFMSVTNTDALLLLPWKYDDDTKRSFIFADWVPQQIGLLFLSLPLIEDGGQTALQTSYLTTHSSLLTWVSMAFSWASIAYLLITIPHLEDQRASAQEARS